MRSPYWQYLQQCLHSGDFNGVTLGMTRDQVRAVLGEPDDTGGTSRKQRIPSVWKYGEVELHFDTVGITSGTLGRFFWDDVDGNWISIDESGSRVHRHSD